jgi:hypothetical protein
VLTHEHGHIGVEKQFTIASRIPVGRDVDAGTAAEFSVALMEPGIQTTYLFRTAAIRAVQIPSEALVGADAKTRGQYVVYLEQVAKRTKVNLKRR